MSDKPVVRVIGTGGTIATVTDNRMDFTNYPDTGRRIPVAESLKRIPEANFIAEIRSEDLMSEARSDIGPQNWPLIARRINRVFREEPDVDGVVLTHGTGTMEETAYFLQLTVKTCRPVVMTGAMRPASAVGTDADLNLYNAIRVAADPNAAGRGVLVVMNNQIHNGRDVTKTDPLHVETFKDSDTGLLGYCDPDGQVAFYRSVERKHTINTPFDPDEMGALPRVDIVPTYAGADEMLVNAVRSQGSPGLILAGVGGGSSASPAPPRRNGSHAGRHDRRPSLPHRQRTRGDDSGQRTRWLHRRRQSPPPQGPNPPHARPLHHQQPPHHPADVLRLLTPSLLFPSSLMGEG